MTVTRVDYDVEQHRDYSRGRALSDRAMQVWLDAFAAALPERRPLVGVDVGSGTGRFTPSLARAFGPVTGVEPSARMREVALAQADVAQAGASTASAPLSYLEGSAEAIPLPDASADYALLFCSITCRTGRPQCGSWRGSCGRAAGC